MLRLDCSALERHQVFVYLGAIGCGLGAGQILPTAVSQIEALLWPVLGLLLFVTFLQVPLLHVTDALRDRRFLGAILAGNFLFLPLVVWALSSWLPENPALRLGVLLVLLAPCTDWFLTFCHLGRGDPTRALAATPALLLLQLVLLPGYLWLMADGVPAQIFAPKEVWPALLIIGVPLVAAVISERLLESWEPAPRWREHFASWPVPLLAVVVFLIAATQAQTVIAARDLLPLLTATFVAFLLVAALVARAIAAVLQMPPEQGRTLAFSFGTRNSFVVLPFALALPTGWEVSAVVIVTQSLIELFGMSFYLWWIPRRLFL